MRVLTFLSVKTDFARFPSFMKSYGVELFDAVALSARTGGPNPEFAISGKLVQTRQLDATSCLRTTIFSLAIVLVAFMAHIVTYEDGFARSGCAMARAADLRLGIA